MTRSPRRKKSRNPSKRRPSRRRSRSATKRSKRRSRASPRYRASLQNQFTSRGPKTRSVKKNYVTDSIWQQRPPEKVPISFKVKVSDAEKHVLVTTQFGELEKTRRVNVTAGNREYTTECSVKPLKTFNWDFPLKNNKTIPFTFCLFQIVDTPNHSLDLYHVAKDVSCNTTSTRGDHHQFWVGFVSKTVMETSKFHHAVWCNGLKAWVHWCWVALGRGKKHYATASVRSERWDTVLQNPALATPLQHLLEEQTLIKAPIIQHAVTFPGEGFQVPCSTGAHTTMWSDDLQFWFLTLDIVNNNYVFGDEVGGTAEDNTVTANEGMDRFLKKEIHEELGLKDDTLQVETMVLNDEINLNVSSQPNVVDKELQLKWQSESPHAIHRIGTSKINLTDFLKAHEEGSNDKRQYIQSEVSDVVFVIPSSERDKYISLASSSTHQIVNIKVAHTIVNNPDLKYDAEGFLLFTRTGALQPPRWRVKNSAPIKISPSEYAHPNDEGIKLDRGVRVGPVYAWSKNHT